MKKYLFAALFCLSLCSAYCQISKIERYDDIDLLTIANKGLIPLLDEVLETERRRDYYRTDSPFSIFFQADSTIQIEAFNLLFSLSETASEDYYGVIEYGGHFYTDSAYEENGKTVLLLFPDDSHSQWIYRYDGDKFRLLDFVDTAPDE